MLRPEVVSNLVGDGVHSLLVVVDVDVGPSGVAAPLADAVEVAEPLNALDVSGHEKVHEAVLCPPTHFGDSIQDTLFVFTRRNEIFQMCHMFDVKVEVVVRRIREYCFLVDIIDLLNVFVEFLFEDILIVVN